MYVLQQLINALSVGGVYALVAVGFALVYSILKFSNWSHGAVIMLSSYFGYVMASRVGLPLVPTLLLTMVAGGFLAVIIELVAFRQIRLKNGPLIYFFVTSITVSTGAQFAMYPTVGGNFFRWPEIISSTAIQMGGVTVSTLNLMMGGVCLLALVVLNLILFRTRIGTAIRAASNDVRAAALMGVDINFVIAATFFLSGALGGLAGTLMGISYTTYPEMGAEAMVKGFVAAVVGGLGSISGAVMGGILLALVETVVTMTPVGSSAAPVAVFAILLVLLFVRPWGIAGKATDEKA
ncbi:MAG TPA: branched-chain amino acid ABC transporter permease [Chloroflexota bacterium]|nr:branched-chain amino acid ABC transporter permease [Chloroflexota bacterium]